MTTAKSTEQTLRDAEKKMMVARAALVLDQPFFGVLALKLKMVADPSQPTAWVDGRHLGYNPTWIDSLTLEQTKGLVVHEVMHCACGHPWRRGQREPFKWNVACDLVINAVISQAGFELPEGGLNNVEEYAGKYSEWVYARLPDIPRIMVEIPGGGRAPFDDVRDAGSGPGDDGEGKDESTTEEGWRIATTQAAEMAKARGQLPASLADFAASAGKPKVDWRSVLRRFVQQVSRSDYSWARPNPRYVHYGLYLPALHSVDLGTIVVGIDTSGSVDDVTLSQFEKEIQAIADESRPIRIHAIYCDAAVQKVETYERDERVELKHTSRGGTDFRPVFRYVQRELGDEDIACLIYLTDLEGPFPDPPPYPTLWATINDHDVPFGEKVLVAD